MESKKIQSSAKKRWPKQDAPRLINVNIFKFCCTCNYLNYLRKKIEILQDIDLNQTLIPWVGKSGKMIAIYLDQKMQDLGFHLTGKQWLLLRILFERDGRPQHELAVVTDRNKASLVRLINNMERNMLVVRKSDPDDRRINRIFLSKKGKEVYSKTLPATLEAFLQLQDGITAQEIEQTIETMQKLLRNIDKISNTKSK